MSAEIAITRSSNDTASARERLMKAFDLDEPQANYILDMQLRRLTKFSRIELESEKDQLSSQIAEYTRIVTSDDELRKVVADELTAVSKKYGTPRRTVLLGSTGITATDVPLEVPDEPCWILMSATGHLARIDTTDPLPSDGPRADHDVITSATRTTTRGEFGVITSAGRLIRARAIDLVSLPATATAPSTSGGSPLTDLIDLWTSLVQHLAQLLGTIGDEETVGKGWAQFHCRDHGTQLGQRTGTDDGPERRCCRVRGGVDACHPFRLGLCGSER